MPLAHPSSLPTKTSNPHRDRGNISILSIVWLGVTALCLVVMSYATSAVLHRAQLQASADAIALACMIATDAMRLS